MVQDVDSYHWVILNILVTELTSIYPHVQRLQANVLGGGLPGNVLTGFCFLEEREETVVRANRLLEVLGLN